MSSDMSTETEVDSSSPSVDQVSAYIHLFEPDTALGHGPVESLLRCYSSEGLELIHAAEGGSTGAGSGGYVDFIANHLQRNFIKCDNSSSSSSSSGSDDMSSSTTGVLELHAGRNPDISEIHLLLPATHSSSPATIIKFGRVYGFRNIQSMLLKLKRQKLDLDFIEVMACPSGCVNGGGQIKTSERETNAAMKDRISRVDTLYHSRKCASLDDSPLLKYLYGSVLPHQSINQEASPVIGSATPEKTYNGTGISREWADKLFHTRFHAVPKLEILSPLTAKW